MVTEKNVEAVKANLGHQNRKKIFRDSSVPKYYPIVRSIFCDAENRLWIEVRKKSDHKEFVVFDVNGTKKGKIRLANNPELLWVDKQYIWLANRLNHAYSIRKKEYSLSNRP